MRVLWISCLLIGSITCGPVGKGSVSNRAVQNKPLNHVGFFWDSGRGESSDLGSSSSLPSLHNPSPNMANGNTGGYVGYGYGAADVYSSPEVGEYGVAYAPSHGYESSAPVGSYGGNYAGAYEGEGSYGSVSAPRDENWSSGSATDYSATVGEPQPVFSDVSDLEPVYSFSSRSSYQRGRAMFAQTRYSPGEPVLPPMPVYKPIIKTVSKQRSPAKAPTKGGY